MECNKKTKQNKTILTMVTSWHNNNYFTEVTNMAICLDFFTLRLKQNDECRWRINLTLQQFTIKIFIILLKKKSSVNINELQWLGGTS